MSTPSRGNEHTTSKVEALKHLVVTNPIHPLHGHSVTVIRWRGSGESAYVEVEHPDGGMITLPLADTSARGNFCKQLSVGPISFLDLDKLIILAKQISVKMTDSS